MNPFFPFFLSPLVIQIKKGKALQKLRAPPETTNGRAEGGCGIWPGASNEHTPKWVCVVASNAARCHNHRSPKGLRVFFPAAALRRTGQARCGDWPVATPCRWKKSAATRPFVVSGGALNSPIPQAENTLFPQNFQPMMR